MYWGSENLDVSDECPSSAFLSRSASETGFPGFQPLCSTLDVLFSLSHYLSPFVSLDIEMS